MTGGMQSHGLCCRGDSSATAAAGCWCARLSLCGLCVCVSRLMERLFSKVPLPLTLRPSSIGGEGAEERHTGIPACQGVSDLGPLPRQRYPLVALLSLAQPEGSGHIVSPDPASFQEALRRSSRGRS